MVEDARNRLGMLRKKCEDYLYNKKKRNKYEVLRVFKLIIAKKRNKEITVEKLLQKRVHAAITNSLNLTDEYPHLNLYKLQRDQMERNAFYRIRDAINQKHEEFYYSIYERIKEENDIIFNGQNRNIYTNYGSR